MVDRLDAHMVDPTSAETAISSDNRQEASRGLRRCVSEPDLRPQTHGWSREPSEGVCVSEWSGRPTKDAWLVLACEVPPRSESGGSNVGLTNFKALDHPSIQTTWGGVALGGPT